MIQIFIVLFLIILSIFSISSPSLVDSLHEYLSSLRKRIENKFHRIKTYDDLNEMLEPLGYSYEVSQNIFISNYDAWQRQMGYCKLFDEAAATVSMIIDCEPIYFEYDNKRWLVEFWKGQYGMTTGIEIGVYYTDGPDINFDDLNFTWFECVNDDDMLDMSFTLIKSGQILMKRKAKHWWLIGLMLGEFSNPDELIADISITLKDNAMRNRFVGGLRNTGYIQNVVVKGNTVSLQFDKPKTPQPYTRMNEFEGLTQFKNKLLCDKYQYLTAEFDNVLDKLAAVQRMDPVLFERILMMGKSKLLFSEYENIKASMEWQM